MKCPKCQAKLLPVDGELFCLQCGVALAMRNDDKSDGPKLEETSDPLLQRAITEVSSKPVHFQLPVSQAPPAAPKTKAFNSMRAILTPPRVAMAPGGAAMAPVVPFEGAREVAPLTRSEAKAKQSSGGAWSRPSAAWLTGLGVFVVFVLANVGISNYYANRVYPGVKVGGANLGGLPFEALHQRLNGLAPGTKLSVEVGASKYVVDMGDSGELDIERAERELRQAGRNTPLPLAGAVQSLFSKPVTLGRMVDDETAKALAGQVAAKINHQASDAVPMIVGTQAFVISEKTGGQVNEQKLATDIKTAYEANGVVKLTPDKLAALVPASAYAGDIQQAQAMMALNLHVTVRTANYTVPAAQIGSWLAFRGPGKGVAVDGAGVSAYVASLPGTFDRAGTANALVAAIQNKQNLDYKASTKKTTAPRLASAAAAWPLSSYSYCVQSDNAADEAALAAKTASVTGAASGWALGGRLRYVKAEADCNFTVRLMPADKLAELSPACAGQSTCQVDNVLAVSAGSWAAAPASWTGGVEAYRGELINHELGHWLGFEHASCTSKATAEPVLTAPTLVLTGCSPNWYTVPIETQGTKVLPGF